MITHPAAVAAVALLCVAYMLAHARVLRRQRGETEQVTPPLFGVVVLLADGLVPAALLCGGWLAGGALLLLLVRGVWAPIAARQATEARARMAQQAEAGREVLDQESIQRLSRSDREERVLVQLRQRQMAGHQIASRAAH